MPASGDVNIWSTVESIAKAVAALLAIPTTGFGAFTAWYKYKESKQENMKNASNHLTHQLSSQAPASQDSSNEKHPPSYGTRKKRTATIFGISLGLLVLFIGIIFGGRYLANHGRPDGTTNPSTEILTTVLTRTTEPEPPTTTEPAEEGMFLTIYAGSQKDVNDRKAAIKEIKLTPGIKFTRDGKNVFAMEPLRIAAKSFRYKGITEIKDGKSKKIIANDIIDVTCYKIKQNWITNNRSVPASMHDVPGYKKGLFLYQTYNDMDSDVYREYGLLFKIEIKGYAEKWYAVIKC